MSVCERVARGVALLDEKAPGWVDRIDVKALNIASFGNCVLGQLYQNFDNGRKSLGLTPPESAEHGFLAKDHGVLSFLTTPREYIGHIYDDYVALTAEWRRVIGVLCQETPVEKKEMVLV